MANLDPLHWVAAIETADALREREHSTEKAFDVNQGQVRKFVFRGDSIQ